MSVRYARYELQWYVATCVLSPATSEAALHCAALVKRTCTRFERRAALTHALVLFERVLVGLQGRTARADDLRACVLLTMQLTIDAELSLDAGLVCALGMETPLHEAQAAVMRAAAHRLFMSEAQFVMYRDALEAVEVG
jgi:hypothetical protein